MSTFVGVQAAALSLLLSTTWMVTHTIPFLVLLLPLSSCSASCNHRWSSTGQMALQRDSLSSISTVKTHSAADDPSTDKHQIGPQTNISCINILG